jgi:hypothetical protein
MGKVKPYCPTCGEPVSKDDAVEIWRDHTFGIRRSEAAEIVADSLWRATEALHDVLSRRRGRQDEEDWSLSSWEEDKLREVLDEFRHAQQVFKAAREKARV